MRFTKKHLFAGILESEYPVIRLKGLDLTIPRRFIPHFVHRDYEPVTVGAFLAAVERGSTVVDVGAHIGYFSCLAALASGPRGTVHAVEPCPTNAQLLRQNLRLNGIENVVVHEVAAAGVRTRRAFRVTHSSDSHGFYEHPLATTVMAIEIEGVPLDALVKDRATVIKIDVEGAEIEVLSGMVRLLRISRGATVIIEWNPGCLMMAGRGPMELPRMLERLGVRDLVVLDDHSGKTRSLREVEEEIAAGRTPPGWYVNLRGRVA